jgi:lysyl-tRNA synthetase, class I
VLSSGVSPSGTYHLGTLREVLTTEAILRELKRRGRRARHIHVVDDLDVFRKVPVDVPSEFNQYLGRPLCDIPAPDGSDRSYADFFLADLLEAAKGLHLEMEVMRAHQKYRSGYFTVAIERALTHTEQIRKILEAVAGRKLDEQWSPVQIIEEGYLKNRKFIGIDTDKKKLTYEGKDGGEESVGYENGQVKLNWRIDWPARWWLLGVDAEPFGRDHATKGGSYDTGAVIAREVFGAEPPLPLPYNFINKTGDTKKMSKSAGDTVTATELLTVLPAEVVWFFVIRFAPEKQLFFDQGPTLMRLFDEFGELLAKPDKTEQENQLLELCLYGVEKPTISRIPFTHLVASYQAALKDSEKTLDVMRRTEHIATVDEDQEIIREELRFIDAWLRQWAPAEVKFELRQEIDEAEFNETQKQFLHKLAAKVASAPEDTDGEWFHKAIYEFKESLGLDGKELFTILYQALIGKSSGPRAGWFLSILPRDWLLARLRLER